jgi:hypothetical protein
MSETTERLAPQFSSRLAATFSLRNERLFLVALALAVAPLWFGRQLPMVDLPQHAGQVVALQQMWAGNGAFLQAFEINWFTPYLLGYLLLYLASLVLPIEVATQLVVTVAIVAVPWLTGTMLRAAGADERWKWLAIPGSYSFAFYWGFLSFIVAVPFALLFLIHTFRFARAPTLKGGVLTATFATFLFFCHVIVLGFTSAVAVGYLIGLCYRDLKGLALRMLPYAAPLPLIVGWLLLTHSKEASVQNAPIVYGFLRDRVIALLVQPAGLDHSSLLIGLLVTAAIALLPAAAGARFSRRPERWLPFAIGLVLFLAVPSFAFNTGFLYQRLGVFLVPLWLIAWDSPDERSRRLDWIAMLVVLLWALVNSGRFAAFARETESFRQVMAAMEPGRRAASMIQGPASPFFYAPVYLHFPAWYQAQRHGIVDFNFADFHPQLVRYKDRTRPRIGEQLAWYPTEFRWERDGGSEYDYFIVKAGGDIAPEIFKDRQGSVKLIARSGWWWLYQNTERAAVSPTSLQR